MSDIGVQELDILGGEPTLYPKFSSLIDIVYRNKIKTTISSNGTNVKVLKELDSCFRGKENADLSAQRIMKMSNPPTPPFSKGGLRGDFKSYFRKNDRKNGLSTQDLVNIGISLNSDAITTELHEYIITHKPMIKSVCTKKKTIPESVKSYIGLSGIQYYLLYMDTLCADDLKESLPFYEFYKTFNNLKKTHKNVDGIFCSGFIPDTENYPILKNVRCPAGTTKLSVMPDGSVYPCYLFFRNDEFRLGNILKDSFSSIWNNPFLDYFRKFEKNRCANVSCELFAHCHGGCPALSFLFYNDLNAPDPRCALT